MEESTFTLNKTIKNKIQNYCDRKFSKRISEKILEQLDYLYSNKRRYCINNGIEFDDDVENKNSLYLFIFIESNSNCLFFYHYFREVESLVNEDIFDLERMKTARYILIEKPFRDKYNMDSKKNFP